MWSDTGGEGSAKGARSSRGKARSKESLRIQRAKYELKYERKNVNSHYKSFLPEPIN